MKGTEKTPQTLTRQENSKQDHKTSNKKPKTRAAAGKPAGNCTGKRLKSPKKRNKEGLWALILAGVLIIFSACISAAVIIACSGQNEITDEDMAAAGLGLPLTENIDETQTAQERVPQLVPEYQPPIPAPYPQSLALAASNIPPERVPEYPPEYPPENRGTIVFVIDDAGNNLHELEPFLDFPGHLTIAVLPGLPYSAEAARRIREAGMEVILHQPMEAVGGQWPGPGAIYADMTAEEIRSILKRNVAEIAPIAGINNHMGSRITANEEIMETILAFARENDLYFLDSRTTGASVVPAVARRLGIEIGQRDVFIDNDPNEASILRSITAGLSLAELRGHVVMIGHIQSAALAPLLHWLYPQLIEQGFSFAAASSLILQQEYQQQR